MNREQFEQFIIDNYDIKPDYPWIKYPAYKVFRHRDNQKWFAVIMDISKDKLGLESTEILSIANLKCDPVLIHLLREKPGFFPAYHMNKENWITVALDGSVSEEKIKNLIEMSYTATESKRRK